MYTIFQKNGRLADAAKQYESLRMSGNMDAAKALYRSVTGKDGAVDGSVWWIYNASHSITCHMVKSYADITGNPNSERYARAMCAAAEIREGGEWSYYWEY